MLAQSLNRDSSFLDAVLDGVFTVPGDGIVDYAAVLAPIARAGYAAGSWSRRNRTRRSHPPPSTPTWAIATCVASRTHSPSRDAGVRPPRIHRQRCSPQRLLRPSGGAFGATPGYPRLMEGPMVGAVTPGSILVWSRASGEFDVVVEYSTDPGFSAAAKSAPVRATAATISRCA